LPPPTPRKVSILPPVSENPTDSQSDRTAHADQRLLTSNGPRRSQDLERVSIVGSGSEWDSISGHMSTGGRSAKSIDSIEEDKLEIISNQMVVTFLELLAAMEDQGRGDADRRVEFRCFALSSGIN